MAFPPRFLDELRHRISLAEIVGRRVKLVRRGREYTGLCPFHNEKTPSFSVVEEKGFYHCFGCSAHGDVIAFVMQTENLSFPEAVDQLARKAGLEVPKATPEERQRAERAATLQGALEAACAFFESQLRAPEGRAAREYLAGRGLDDAAIRRFRLGFAPDGREALKRALGGKFPEVLLLEAGLIHQSDDGRAPFDYFRNRVIFPIGDRGGRIIAFGGRVIGDGQPKYLNSPETPLFAKGRNLYGWAAARAAAARDNSAIVAEGYMDVIALHRAGFGTAVAPLGTALTETQIEELWRLAPEPILCFDGDAAGQRAAARALDRALPLLKPGHSLRFALLPAGEDPDTLIHRQGAAAMRAILDAAAPLAEMLWTIEKSAGPLRTPEQRAALRARLRARVRQVAERSVQQEYIKFFAERLSPPVDTRRFIPRPDRRAAGWRVASARRDRLRRSFLGSADWLGQEPIRAADPQSQLPAVEEVLLAYLLNHPFLLGEAAEELAQIDFPAVGKLDSLSRKILELHHRNPALDAETLKGHLNREGFGPAVERILSPRVLEFARFARAGADVEAVRSGWVDIKRRYEQQCLLTQIAEAERSLAVNTTEETLARLRHLQEMLYESQAKDDDASGDLG
ncbi:MAG: DNA primase [Alphaproteobacteria bacterium]|nr:DNA primase [Alphaproteobacteria bacterium]